LGDLECLVESSQKPFSDLSVRSESMLEKSNLFHRRARMGDILTPPPPPKHEFYN
jgi:hypothetical protein